MTLNRIFYINLLIVFVFYLVPKYSVYIIPEIATVYSDNYKKEKFNKIKLNMSKSVVYSILGKPLSSYNQSEGSVSKTVHFYSNYRYSFMVYQSTIIEFYDCKVKHIYQEYAFD